MNTVKKLLLFLIFSLCLLACKSNTEQSLLSDIKAKLSTDYKIKIADDTANIFYINDDNCGNCVYALSEYLKENFATIEDKNTRIVINSRGQNVDLDFYLAKAKSNKNIAVKTSIETADSLFRYSFFVAINNNEIDTMLTISPTILSEQVGYIMQKFYSSK